MKFIKSKYQIGLTDVVVMQYEDFNPLDYFDQLTEIEKERFFEFKNEKRKQEFVATRMLRHDLFGFEHIHYDQVGAPYIKGVGNISISHTDNFVGIAYSKDYRLGLDIEWIRPKISKIAHKFVSQEEMKFFQLDSIFDLTLVWTAKEAMYKLSKRKGLSFISNIKIERKGADTLIGRVIGNPEVEVLEVQLNYLSLDDLIITVNSSASEQKNI